MSFCGLGDTSMTEPTHGPRPHQSKVSTPMDDPVRVNFAESFNPPPGSEVPTERPRASVAKQMSSETGTQSDRLKDTTSSADADFLGCQAGDSELATDELISKLHQVFSLLLNRYLGDYPTDEFGFDPQWFWVTQQISKYFFEHYWRCEVQGKENIPATGPALIIANRSSFLPWDGEMLRCAVSTQAKPQCWLLNGSIAPRLPFVSALLSRTARTLQSEANVRKLLERGNVVIGFPEGERAAWKTYHQRFKIYHFYDGFLLNVARELGVPVIPAVVMGAAESYPVISRYPLPGKPLGVPYFPITPVFPWLPPPFCLLMLPIKWRIRFLAPLTRSVRETESDEFDSLEASETCRRLMQQALVSILKKLR